LGCRDWSIPAKRRLECRDRGIPVEKPNGPFQGHPCLMKRYSPLTSSYEMTARYFFNVYFYELSYLQ
jgi:hypothetical protein